MSTPEIETIFGFLLTDEVANENIHHETLWAEWAEALIELIHLHSVRTCRLVLERKQADEIEWRVIGRIVCDRKRAWTIHTNSQDIKKVSEHL